ncbi:ribbon-helix-helix domain-containing protein [Staphylospora marina]|uniref:ribbon-helix-helix domain-containing protein n=1 Tax=Staphylospora marina TaxID=2490858 RepID=UPI000F5BAB04|nr:ribbon-helix-helix domain-containing protein [Staphylospora marina]
MIIYKATNLKSGKVYIGASKYPLEKRQNEHRLNMRDKQQPFYVALREDGWESFAWEVIDEARSLKELAEKERHWIQAYNSNDPEHGYNASPGGAVSTNEIIRKKFSVPVRMDLRDALDQLSRETRINKSVLLDEAIELLLEKYKWYDKHEGSGASGGESHE